jgi:hypothetical protein
MDDHRPLESLQNRRRRFKERARAEYLAGAEMEWRKRNGRSMTVEELQRALRRYPGDA